MNYALYIARRMRLGASPSIVVAIAGVALSVAVMLWAVCVVTGFKHEIRDKVLGFDAHVSVLPASPDVMEEATSFAVTPRLYQIIDSTRLFTSIQRVVEQPGMLKTDSDFEGIVLRGITPGPAADFIGESIVSGEMPLLADSSDNRRIAVSAATASALRLSPGDKVLAYFFTDGSLRTRRLEIAGVYDTHFAEYDRLYAYGPVSLTRGIRGMDSTEVSRLDLYIDNPDADRIDDSALRLQQAMMLASYSGTLPGTYRLSAATRSGAMYFNWLALLDTNVAVVLALMALVAGFTLVSSLFIIILDRVPTIGILKTIGTSNSGLRSIFVYTGWRLVAAGMIIGNAVALTTLILQERLHLLPLDPDAYYLSYVPVEINPATVLLLNAAIFVVAWAVLLIPASMVGRIAPASTVRYE